MSKTPKYRVFNGVNELPKDEAYLLEPYDTVSVSGFYRSQPDINDAISKEAKKKGAASFFIVRQVDANSGGNQFVTAYIYKADAPKRRVQSPDAIPADSDAGRAWPPVAPLPRKSKFLASRLPVRQAATWAVSSKPSPLPANAIPSRCLTAPRSRK